MKKEQVFSHSKNRGFLQFDEKDIEKAIKFFTKSTVVYKYFYGWLVRESTLQSKPVYRGKTVRYI